MKIVDLNGNAIHHFPHKLPNGLLLLRFTEPSHAHNQGRVFLNNPRARENYTAVPSVLNLQIVR